MKTDNNSKKIEIEVDIESYSIYDFQMSLSKGKRFFNELEKKYKKEYKKLNFKLSYDGDYKPNTYSLRGTRLETDDEFSNRLIKMAKVAEYKSRSMQKLKKEYGNG